MSDRESDFIKNLKKWVWSWLLGQLLIVLVMGAIFYGQTTSAISTNTKEIDSLKASKADIATVMRIKADIDTRNSDIILRLNSIEQQQQHIIDILITMKK
jgi:hypothetical protein